MDIQAFLLAARQTALHGFGHCNRLRQGERDGRINADAEISGLFHGRHASTRCWNLHNHIWGKLVKANGLLDDRLLVSIESRISLYGEAAVAAALRVKDRLE